MKMRILKNEIEEVVKARNLYVNNQSGSSHPQIKEVVKKYLVEKALCEDILKRIEGDLVALKKYHF